jgi:hypothetical protein
MILYIHTLYITEESTCVRPQVLSIYLEESVTYLDTCCVNSLQIYETKKEYVCINRNDCYYYHHHY